MSKGILILLFTSIFLLSNAILVQESFIHQGQVGEWSNFITAQEQTGNDPSTYFLCGVSFREMKWKKLLYNCDCRKKWYIIGKQTCKWCDNYFTSMRNGFKARFCHSNDWNKQIQQIFETGSTESGQWKQIKCPKGQYVSKTAVRFGYEYQTDLGLTGISMKCDSITSDYGKGAIQQQSIGSNLSAWSQNRYGTFVNGIKLKYVNKDKLSGIFFGYSGVPVIKKVSIDYQKIDFKSEKVNLDYSEVGNRVGMDVQKRISTNTPVPYENTWSNGLPYTSLYEFSTSAKIQQRQQIQSELKPFTKQLLSVQNFALNKPLKSITFAKQQTIIIVPPCRLIKVNTTLTLLSTLTPFNMTIEFANKITQEDMGKNPNIKGQWNGTVVGDIKTDTVESIIEIC